MVTEKGKRFGKNPVRVIAGNPVEEIEPNKHQSQVIKRSGGISPVKRGCGFLLVRKPAAAREKQEAKTCNHSVAKDQFILRFNKISDYKTG